MNHPTRPRGDRRIGFPGPRPLAAALVLILAGPAVAAEPPRFPTIPADHENARRLLENAMHYVAPGNKIVDPASGYPFEGWNQDPKRGLYLRSFTQLTAIGLYLELLADVVAGEADTADLPRDRAFEQLKHLVGTLRQDQRDPKLAARGLLVNFLDLGTGKRVGPLAEDVEKQAIVDALGQARGEAIWKALAARGWIAPRKGDRDAAIVRDDKYGYEHFSGSLAPFADEPTRKKVMDVLDRRVVLVVFGDNSNLSASVAKAIGALMLPEAGKRPGVAAIRAELEAFLDAQAEGYRHLYDPKAGLFDFGWNASKDRLFGWEDAQGNWTIGHMDYLVNEFRGPAAFVAARFGIPSDAIRNLGFKMKPYRPASGGVLYALAPWEGSAFQALGLSISPGELAGPSWRELLGNVVAIEADFAKAHGLPGFLSESYTGRGAEYTGRVGIPEITVAPKPRITDAASLYTLGAAYSIAPERVEAFLGTNREAIAKLLSDHGPWEGFNASLREPIPFQTTAHTLSLALGLIGSGPAHLRRYIEAKGLSDRLDALYRPGAGGDLLGGEADVFAWSDKGSKIESKREGATFTVKGDRLRQLGIAFVPKKKEGLDASAGVLRIGYRSARAIEPLLITFKPVDDVPGLISKDVFARLGATGASEGEIRVPLPASIGLARVKEVVLFHETSGEPSPADLAITRLVVSPAR